MPEPDTLRGLALPGHLDQPGSDLAPALFFGRRRAGGRGRPAPDERLRREIVVDGRRL
jgi:hypothetical protein